MQHDYDVEFDVVVHQICSLSDYVYYHPNWVMLYASKS